MKRTDFDRSFVWDQMSYDPASEYPKGGGIFFECTLCGDVVGAGAADTAECSCGNLVVDIDTGKPGPHCDHGTIAVLHGHPRPQGAR